MPLSFRPGQNFSQTQKSYVQISLFLQEVRIACVALPDSSWLIWSQPHKPRILSGFMFSGPHVSVSQVDIQCFLQPSSRTHLFLVGMLSLVSASFPRLHVDPDPNKSKCCGLNCWIMSHSTALFSLCGQKRKNSGEETLATLPRLSWSSMASKQESSARLEKANNRLSACS